MDFEFECRVSDFGFRILGFGSGFWIRVLGLGFRLELGWESGVRIWGCIWGWIWVVGGGSWDLGGAESFKFGWKFGGQG